MTSIETSMIVDYLVFIGCIVASFVVPLWGKFRGKRKETTKADYVFATGSVSMGAMMLSIARGTLGVRSFLGYPSELYYRGSAMWETLYGMLLAYPIVCFIFVPVYYSLGITSVYQYLDMRFKSKIVRCLASFSYVIRSLLNLAVTIFTPCVALKAVIGLPYWASIVGITGISVIFTLMGGLKAAILSDVIQGLTMIGVSLVIIVRGSADVGPAQVFNVTNERGRLDFFNMDLDPTLRVTTLSATVGQLFMSLSIFGCQQNFVQRYCSMTSQRKVVKWMPCQLKIEPNICSCDYDGIILVSGCAPGFDEPEPFKTVLYSAAQIDSALGVIGAVLPINLPAKRLVYSPTGPLNMDYHDVRSFAEAATKGIQRALKAGVRCPLFALLPDIRFENVELVTLLGALEGLYVPLEVRETCPDRCYKACQLAVWSPICSKKLQGIVKLASALESGRYVARDIGGADPERMAPPRVEEYLAELFCGSNVSMQVVSDQDTLLQEYPLFACVNRAASMIPRHAGRIIFLTYEPPNPACILETVMLVGKGVTYDTGGVDLKIQGTMRGMSRDKCGAAACAGFMQVVNLLQPPTVKAVAALCVVRNSIGENSYVSDEVITAKSGVRVRVGNTDSEGRMAMADALCHIREMALCSVNPHIFTIGTQTCHAMLTVGRGYSIVMDNAVARLVSNAEKLQASGETMGDPFEISRIRREDFKFHEGLTEGDDVLQSANKTTETTERGHQGPSAFLIMASGLDKHGACSCSPLKYTHIDMHGHLPEPHHLPYSGNPVLALSYCYLIQGKCLTVRNDLPFEMQYVCEVDCKPVCIQPCQPCPCPPVAKAKIECVPAPCSCCAQCHQPCEPCGTASCPPVSCQPCPPSAAPCEPCGEPINVIEPVCRPNVPKGIC